MTAATMALTEVAEKGADVDVLRQMVQFMAQRLMELDVEGRCGGGYDGLSGMGLIRAWKRLTASHHPVRAPGGVVR